MQEKQKLLVLKGLPASGKSTHAAALVEQGWVRTNKDTIREELFPNYKRRDEKKVIKERDRQIRDALSSGKNVVVDDTNLNPIHIKALSNIAKEYNCILEIDDSFLNVPLQVCIDRDRAREKSVGENVIRGMFHQYVKHPIGSIKYDPELPMAVICDIDGTLAHMNGGRSPFDWHSVGQDQIDEGVAHVLDCIYLMDYAKIFLFSGRNEICRPETEAWLRENDIEYHELHMRPADRNDEDDRVIKKDMLLENIVGKYNVLFVLDDRPKVCRMWRDDFGLRVLQCGDPHHEF